MSQQSSSLDEELQSPDLFSDPETINSPESTFLDESNSASLGPSEPEPMDDTPEWKGISMDEIYKGLGPFGYQQHPPIGPSETHTVMFQLPWHGRGPPRAYPTNRSDKWNVGYVRMPHSPRSLYPVEQASGTREFRLRWEVIQEKLLQSFVSCAQFECAVLSYNNKYAQRWDFGALRHFFEDVVEEEETNYFFTKLLPKIIQLALQLPNLVTGPIPLLKRHTNRCVSFSQLQVSSLLANAFLCTFPRRNSTNPQSEYAAYPFINFNKLFSAYREDKPNRSNAVMEKLKCLFHYFRRVITKAPEGTITIQRRYIPKEDCLQWEKLDHKLPLLHITSKGTIETEGAGLLQVDFANKYVGGGVLNWGCVQEEIRFVICPELMVTMLVTEALDDTEALIVSGIERYSKYDGYSDNFTWDGDFVDETPRDNSGRRRTSVVAIDALYFRQPNTQFSKENMLRELNKAYVGFSSTEISEDDLPAIATGNWGCGAFRGNPKLKVLLQLMSAAAAGRSMVYFTFGDTNLRDSIADMYWHLVQRNVDLGQLFTMLSQYESASSSTRSDFYRFLYNRSRIKPITHYFEESVKNSDIKGGACKKEAIIGARKTDKEKCKILRGSVVKEKEKYEEEKIMKMLEESTKMDLEKPMEIEIENSTVSKKATNKDLTLKITKQEKPEVEMGVKERKENGNCNRELQEQKDKSLWDVLRDRESRPISGSRESGLDLIPTMETNISNKEISTEQDIALSDNRQDEVAKTGSSDKDKRPVSSASNEATKKNSPRNTKNQTKILDFFPRKIP